MKAFDGVVFARSSAQSRDESVPGGPRGEAHQRHGAADPTLRERAVLMRHLASHQTLPSKWYLVQGK
ncbi:hypothetical protein ATCCBAA256_32030 [Mycobacterium montefiorense]|nr:hypothetical protein ATCCBAA256_32030 [Mycobacterium montefiorense]